ncbi:hypothetical protein FP2506_11287 [Fulvimarina pelagi HTCC2506]|uniref:Uncharacterized protein n=1 Tax=Fulvimarina pelagi HTCC2506 TaxID=314231 RepID=Q0FZ22_9HYPH|nr:hypothetical protein [Fulvimarina pelagi]EAU40136.1 hypothetical protein FP2506_11287 [Fulvimarina pelagi HTCC2506]
MRSWLKQPLSSLTDFIAGHRKVRVARRRAVRMAADVLLLATQPRGAWSEAKWRRNKAYKENDKETAQHWAAVMDRIVELHGPQERADTATRYLEP